MVWNAAETEAVRLVLFTKGPVSVSSAESASADYTSTFYLCCERIMKTGQSGKSDGQ